MKEKPYNWRQRIRSAIGRIVQTPGVGKDEALGVVATPYGFVVANRRHSKDGSRDTYCVFYQFIHLGIEYRYSHSGYASRHVMAREAHAFAKRIVAFSQAEETR